MTVKIEILDALTLTPDGARRICAAVTAFANQRDEDDVNSVIPEKKTQVTLCSDKHGELGMLTDFTAKDPEEPTMLIRNHENKLEVADETDSEGTLYDERIHTQKRLKDSQGLWKLKRNIDPDFVQFVKSKQPARPQEAPTDEPKQKPQREFAYLIAKIENLTKTGKIERNSIQRLLQTFGVKNTVDLAKKPELIKQFDAALDNIMHIEQDLIDEGDDE